MQKAKWSTIIGTIFLLIMLTIMIILTGWVHTLIFITALIGTLFLATVAIDGIDKWQERCQNK